MQDMQEIMHDTGMLGDSETHGDLDAEWVRLILTAQSMGISLEEIRLFLQEASPQDLDQ